MDATDWPPSESAVQLGWLGAGVTVLTGPSWDEAQACLPERMPPSVPASTPRLVACTRVSPRPAGGTASRCGPGQAGHRLSGPRPSSASPLPSVPGQPSAGTPSTRCWPRGRRRCPPPRDTERGAPPPVSLPLAQWSRQAAPGEGSSVRAAVSAQRRGRAQGRCRSVSWEEAPAHSGPVLPECPVGKAHGREATSYEDIFFTLFS